MPARFQHQINSLQSPTHVPPWRVVLVRGEGVGGGQAPKNLAKKDFALRDGPTPQGPPLPTDPAPTPVLPPPPKRMVLSYFFSDDILHAKLPLVKSFADGTAVYVLSRQAYGSHHPAVCCTPFLPPRLLLFAVARPILDVPLPNAPFAALLAARSGVFLPGFCGSAC